MQIRLAALSLSLTLARVISRREFRILAHVAAVVGARLFYFAEFAGVRMREVDGEIAREFLFSPVLERLRVYR